MIHAFLIFQPLVTCYRLLIFWILTNTESLQQEYPEKLAYVLDAVLKEFFLPGEYS